MSSSEAPRGGDRANPPPHRESPASWLFGAIPVEVLPLVRPLAVMAISALLLGRAVGPSTVGMGVGVDQLSWVIEFAGSLLSQLFALMATVVAVAGVLTVLRSHVGIHIQVSAVAVGGVVVLVAATAAANQVPRAPAALVAILSAAFAVMAAIDAIRVPFARPAAAMVGVVGMASAARLLALGAYGAAIGRFVVPTVVPRALATVAFAAECLALGIGLAWLASRSKKVTTPVTLVVLVIAFLLTRQAMVTNVANAAPAAVVLRRGAERLLAGPDPFVPIALRLFVALLGPLAAAAVLLARGQVPALAGATALALLVGSRSEMPLGALSLLIASLTVCLAARDDRGLWAALSRASEEHRAA